MNGKLKLGNILFYIAPILAIFIILFTDLEPGKPEVTNTLAVAIWMALWWVSERIPLGITSVLPIVLFPVLGIMNGKAVSEVYYNHVIFLFIGGFLVALAIQKWDLHKRIALFILKKVGGKPGSILFGFMFATGFLSMWISNTATTMLMLPMALAISIQLSKNNSIEAVKQFEIGLLLSIAYSASIGGIATLVGTPPNLSFARIYNIYYPDRPEISFSDWFIFAAPISIILFFLLWLYTNQIFVRKKQALKKLDDKEIENNFKALGKSSFEEKILLIAFASLVMLWFFRADINIGNFRIPGWSNLFKNPKYFNDGTVAILIATLLFIIPSKKEKGKYLLDWKTAERIPWEIILLFGGGFALATGFKESGLSEWFGHQLEWLENVHPFIIILAITFLITFLTELTSNTATVETFLPIMAGLAGSINVDPLLFMLPATIAASLAFMLPVATPPNAIIFASGKISVADMAKAGFRLNLIGILVVSIMTYYWGRWVFGL